jgi:8-hydroxy-5-deazaflavin:NADPH oxidoreductase
MKIAIMGSGNVGGTLGRRFAGLGHDVIFGSRDPHGQKMQALLGDLGTRACSAPLGEAAAAADIVFLATPWSATEETLQAAGDLGGKVLVDCTNPLGPGMQLLVGLTTSGGEQVASWARGARVVKAFNSIGAAIMADPNFNGQAATLYMAGDDAAAKATVAQLGQALGFDVCDCGPLTSSRLLEPLCGLWVNLAYMQGMGPGFTFKLIRR